MTTCIPRTSGVPGLSGPPNWLSGADKYDGLDDPRWRGAFRVGYGGTAITPGGTDEEAAFRAKYTDASLPLRKNLYLSWHVKFDPAVDAAADALYVGFETQGVSAKPIVLKITPYATAAAGFEAQNVDSIQATRINTDGTVDTVLGDDPDWVNAGARAWLELLPPPTPGAQPIAWAIQMVVPVGEVADGTGVSETAIDLADTFKMWSSMRIAVPDTVEPDGFVDYNWPTGSASLTQDALLNDVYPAVSTWESMEMDPTCAPTVGVSLASTDVGATPAPDHRIFFTKTADLGPGESKPINTFFARPQNDTGALINAGQITARFRIANWGSVADPNAPWDDIPGGSVVPSTDSIADGAKASTTAINFNWTLSDPEITPYEDGTKDDHQCMLVELSGPGLTFINDSVYRNMDFVEASTFKREATISVKGTGDMPDGSPQRDVFIAEEVRNMPATVGTTGDRPRPRRRRIIDDERGIIGGGGIPDDIQDQLAAAAKRQLTDQQRIEQTTPTYRLHVYHDTGRRVMAGGTEHRILAPQASYGYYVRHQGPLSGWEQSLAGAQPIAPGWYTIPVPVDGEVKVSNQIVAKEGPPGSFSLLDWLRQLLEKIVKFFKKLFGG